MTNPLTCVILYLMNNEKNLPLEAEIVSLRATAEDAKKLRADLQAKATIIKDTVANIELPQGPMYMNGRWYV